MTTISKIVENLCNNLKVEYILKLPIVIQKMIFEMSKEKRTQLARFYYHFLLYHSNPTSNADFFKNTIDIRLNQDNSSDYMVEYIQLDLERNLRNSKIDIDVFHRGDQTKLQFYTYFTNYMDQFKHYIRTIKYGRKQPEFTNAWLKCWEMIIFYKLIPIDHKDDFTIFCNAEFPGAFIFAINHYIKTMTKNKKYEWFGNSLWPGSNKDKKEDVILGDEFGLYKKYRPKGRWLMSATENGDVTDPKMNEYIKSRLYKKVDLYTSDIGIHIPFEHANEQETIEANLNLGQIICALNTLKEGGHMICKTFLFFKPLTMSLLYLLTTVFREFSISKPMTSRPGNSEIYLVGKFYKEDVNVTRILEKILYNWDQKYMDEWIVPVPKTFYLQLVYASYYIYDRQMYFINKNTELATYEYEKGVKLSPIFDIFKRPKNDKTLKEITLRQEIVNEWKRKYQIGPIDKRDQL